MVAITAGKTAQEVGINKLDCASEVTRSMKSVTKLSQPHLRLQLLSKFQRGQKLKDFDYRRKGNNPWRPKGARAHSFSAFSIQKAPKEELDKKRESIQDTDY